MLVLELITRLELTKNLGVEIFEQFVLIFIAKIVSCKPLTSNPFTLLTAGQTQNKTNHIYGRMQISGKR